MGYLCIVNHSLELSQACLRIASGNPEHPGDRTRLLEQSHELNIYLNGQTQFQDAQRGLVDSFDGLALALEFEDLYLSPIQRPKIPCAIHVGLQNLDSVADSLACAENPEQFDRFSTPLAYVFRRWHNLARSVYRGNNTDFFKQLAFKTYERIQRRKKSA